MSTFPHYYIILNQFSLYFLKVFKYLYRIVYDGIIKKGVMIMINTVLVADDNVLDNAILRNCLFNERVNLISALNGREALELVEGRNIDLIILDLVMPVLDGFEFLKQFSKTELYKEIPIIVTSSLDDAKDIETILKYNVFDYIIKPLDNVNRLILLNKIKRAIEYRKILQELDKTKKSIESLSQNTNE